MNALSFPFFLPLLQHHSFSLTFPVMYPCINCPPHCIAILNIYYLCNLFQLRAFVLIWVSELFIKLFLRQLFVSFYHISISYQTSLIFFIFIHFFPKFIQSGSWHLPSQHSTPLADFFPLKPFPSIFLLFKLLCSYSLLIPRFPT